jgi:uncharacterized protein involved in outer membrane biogenesis
MQKRVRLGLDLAAGAAVLVLALMALLFRWANSDDFRARVEHEASAALGMPLKMGTLSVDLLPPAVVARGVTLATSPVLTLERLEARPHWASLLHGRADIGTLVVRGAVLPLAHGQSMTVDAKAQLADGGRLQRLGFEVRQGHLAGAHGELVRSGDHWPLRIEMGAGHIAGKLWLRREAGGARSLAGNLTTVDVQAATLTAPSQVLSGKLQAQTELRAEFSSLGGLAQALQTETEFSVRRAVVHGIDLLRAVKTVGLSRGGSTVLDTLAGRITTRGPFVQLSNLVATSGPLSALGQVAIAPDRKLSGRVTVDVTGSKGAFGVPLVVGGTLEAPSVTLTRGGLLGSGLRGLFGR